MRINLALACLFSLFTDLFCDRLLADPLKVVCTLSTYASITEAVGGDSVSVTTVASPRFNPHFIEPKPSDVLRLKRADLFIHSGLDLEAWRDPLLVAAGNPDVRSGGSRELDLSQGIVLLNVPTGPLSRAQGDIHLFGNPHYYTSPENWVLVAKSISAKLEELLPTEREHIEERRRKLEVELLNRIKEIRQKFAPLQGQRLVAYHDEWVYLANFLGLRVEKFLEPKPGVPPTPQYLLELERYMREQNVKGIIQTSYFPSSDSEHLAERTGAKVVNLCPLVGSGDECQDLLSTLRYNVDQIWGALNH